MFQHRIMSVRISEAPWYSDMHALLELIDAKPSRVRGDGAGAHFSPDSIDITPSFHSLFSFNGRSQSPYHSCFVPFMASINLILLAQIDRQKKMNTDTSCAIKLAVMPNQKPQIVDQDILAGVFRMLPGMCRRFPVLTPQQ